MSLDMYTVIVKKQTNEFEKLDHWKLILYKNTFGFPLIIFQFLVFLPRSRQVTDGNNISN